MNDDPFADYYVTSFDLDDIEQVMYALESAKLGNARALKELGFEIGVRDGEVVILKVPDRFTPARLLVTRAHLLR
jgi:hypothetical protein